LLSVALSSTLPAQSGSVSSSASVFDGAANQEAANPGALSDLGSIQRTPETPPCARKKRGEIAAAPIPVVNPTIGNGLAGAVLYMSNLGPCIAGIPPSTFGLVGLRTSSGSWALGGGANLILHGDLFRISVGGGIGEFNYKFYGIGNAAGAKDISIGIGQRSRAFLIEPKVRVFRRWYVGPRYHIVKTTAHIDQASSSESSDPMLPDGDLKLRTAALGLRTQHDSRDSQFYPRQGSFFDQTLDFYEGAFGGNRSYRSYELAYSKFLSFGSKNVLAVHGSLCTTWGPTPFYDLCALGLSRDLRGYPLGRYQDHRFLSAQVEYRRELFWRIGGVAFMGAGEVGKTFSDFNASDILPGGGLGLRFLLSRASHVNLRLDYALGRDSHALYLGMTEAF
jgi:hypothetical protein